MAAEPVKEYTIGVNVFEKPQDYDPRLDPAVRVEVGRMKAKLTDYYSGEGSTNPGRLEFKKRSYVPTFRLVEASQPMPRRWPLNLLVTAALAIALSAAGTLAWRYVAHRSQKAVENPEARELCSKARFFWNKRTPESLRTSLELYQQAIRSSPPTPERRCVTP